MEALNTAKVYGLTNKACERPTYYRLSTIPLDIRPSCLLMVNPHLPLPRLEAGYSQKRMLSALMLGRDWQTELSVES